MPLPHRRFPLHPFRTAQTLRTTSHRLHIQQRFYQLEQSLPKDFIRISQSEIINMHNIKHLSLSKNGMIHIEMKHGEATYSSRRYLKQLKARLFQ
ncbi:LytTR family DNA-binding domain-containing protein [Staphylococcus simulans]|uniref:LytTR family DNA-binding domain-containing protein n=1 Tax=Staphylococcus simulans TaxID=1286 RepID=UPI00293494E7|nr:LytTR family DNA-binding domain-containing protein [Staphylococcus simulans]